MGSNTVPSPSTPVSTNSTLTTGRLDADIRTDGATELDSLAHAIEAAAAANRIFQKKSWKGRESSCYSGAFCCFRESRISRGECETIDEDLPSTIFDCDLMVLELHSLLRGQRIEPSDTLVTQLLQWQARASKRRVSLMGYKEGSD